MPEEQRVALEVPGVVSLEESPLMGQSRLDKVTGLPASAVPFHVCGGSLSGIQHGVRGWGDLHCL